MTPPTGTLQRLLGRLSRFEFVLVTMALIGLAAATLGPARAPSNRVPGIEAGTLVVADLRGHALTLLDLGGGGATRIALGGGPHELVTLPDRRMAVSLEQLGRVAIVDLATAGVEYLDTGGLPHGLALDGAALLVTDRASGSIRRFDTNAWSEGPSVDGGALPHQVAMAGRTVLVADAAATRLDLAAGRGVPQPALTESIAVSPDGTRVAVAGASDGRVLVYELDPSSGGDAAREVRLGGRPVRVLFDPSGRTLAIALSASGELALVDGTGEARRVAVGGVPDGLAFGLGGRIAFVSDIAGGTVSAVDVASGRVVARLDGGTTAGALAFIE